MKARYFPVHPSPLSKMSLRCFVGWFVSFVVFVSPLYSQTAFSPGKVLTLQGDTLNGFVAELGGSKNHTACLFRQSEKGGETGYSPGEIKGYIIEGRRFFQSVANPKHSILVDSPIVFAEWILLGAHGIARIKGLYYYYDSAVDTLELVRFPATEKYVLDFFEKEDQKTWLFFLNRLSLKCPKVLAHLSYHPNLKPNEASLVSIVKMMNECEGSSYNHFGADLPSFGLKFSANLDVMGSKVAFTTYSISDFPYLNPPAYRETSIGFGISVQEYNPRRWSPLHMTMSVMGRYLTFERGAEGAYLGEPASYSASFDWFDLSLFPGIKYVVINSRPVISLALGPSIQFMASKEARLVEQVKSLANGETLRSTTYSDVYFGAFQPGYFGQISLAPGSTKWFNQWEIAAGLSKGTGVTKNDEVSFDKLDAYNSSSTSFFIKGYWWW
jgi:hypothetical protein